MYYNIAYDISNNKTRRLAVKLCKQAGLVRLQRSLFIGTSTTALISDLQAKLLPKLDPKTDRLHIQPLDTPSYQRLLLFGDLTDKSALAREQKVVFI